MGASRVLAYPTMKRCSSEVVQCSTSRKTKTGGGETSSVVVGEKCYRNMKPVKLRPSLLENLMGRQSGIKSTPGKTPAPVQRSDSTLSLRRCKVLLNADFKDILLALEGVPVHEEVGGEEGGEEGRASGMRMSKDPLTTDEFYVSSSDDEDGESGGAGVAASAPMDFETCLDSLYASNDEEEVEDSDDGKGVAALAYNPPAPLVVPPPPNSK